MDNNFSPFSFLKKDFLHSYERRKFNHDYQAPYKYHIILKKQKNCETFGRITGNASISPGAPGSAKVIRSMLGSIIKKELFDFDENYHSFKILQFIVMPDHVHILLQVKERIPKHLGYYIGRLKVRIAENYSKSQNRIYTTDDIFLSNYTDKIVWSFIDLKTLIRYIKENPHRLAMRQQFPLFFQKLRQLKIGDKDCEAYGNLFLLRNPDKFPLIIHRNYSEEEKSKIAENCVLNSIEKGIIVSAAVSPEEKAIRNLCEAHGGNFILIQHEGFGERFKPAEHNFNLCSQGRLLIIAPLEKFGERLSYATCQKMNQLAEIIAKGL